MATSWLNDLLGYRSIRANGNAAVARRGALRVVAGGGGISVALVDDPALGESVLTLSNDELNVRAFGAVGDGATDDTIAVQAAITTCAAAGGGILFLPEGTYRITSELTWGNGVVIRGAGMFATILDFSAKAAFSYDRGLLLMQGTGRSNPQSVTANVARGALSVNVASGAGYASGDTVQLRSTETYVISDGGTRAEFLRVRYVSGNTVFFTTPTVETYNTGLGTVQLAKMSFATGGVRDLTLKGKGVNPAGVPTPNQYTSTAEINDATQSTRGDYGFEMRFCRDVAFERVRFVDVENQAIYLQSCYGGHVTGCVFEFSAVQVRSQYAVALYRCTTNVRIEGNVSLNCRHFVTTGSTAGTSEDWYFGVPNNCTIVGNIVLGSWQAGIDMHRSGFNFTITGNVLQCYAAGIKTRGQKVVIAGNVVYGPNAASALADYDGIQVQYNCTDVTIADNHVYGHACGIRVSSLDADGENISITDNHCVDSGAYGVRLTTGAFTLRHLQVNDNIIDSPAAYGVYFDGNFEDVECNDNEISGGTYGIRTLATGTRNGFNLNGNILRGAANDSLYLELVNGLNLLGNHCYGANTNGVHIRLRDCKKGSVVGNQVTFPAGATGGTGIYLNATGSGTCQDLAVNGNGVHAPSSVGTGIGFDAQANQFHAIGTENICRSCATPIATDSGASIRNNAVCQTSKTIASDAITAEAKKDQQIIVDTEAAAASDNLATITYAGQPGDRLTLRINNAGRVVTFKDNTGNLRLTSDYAPTSVDSMLSLMWGGSVWAETGRSSN